MKLRIKTLLVLVLALCMLSLSAFAEQQADTQVSPENNTQQTVQSGDVQTPAENTDTPAPEAPIVTAPEVKEEPKVLGTMLASETNARQAVSIVLGEEFSKEYIDKLSTAKEFPLVIDISVFGQGADSLIIPYDLVDAIVNMSFDAPVTQPVATPDATDAGTENVTPETPVAPAVPLANEIVLKVVSKNFDCSWKRDSLKELGQENGTVKLTFATADQIRGDLDTGKAVGGSVAAFTPEMDETYGLLFVSKDDKGNWETTSDYMFSSSMTYILAIVLLAVINFVVLIAINLVIIKIYRTKK